MIKGFLNLPWFVWAAVALAIAVIYFFIFPQKAFPMSAADFRFLVLRYAHTLTWLLLAINFLLRGLSADFNGTANSVAAVGGLMYLLFIETTFVVK